MAHEQGMVLLCDGTWEGLLSALFQAEAMRPRAREIWMEPPAQLSFDPPVAVINDKEHAQRVWRAVQKQLGADAQWTCQALFVSSEPTRGTLLMRYLRRAWRIGACVEEDLGNPDVWAALRVRRRVEFEIHRMKGLVRFANAGNDIFYSAIEPDNDILWQLAHYFNDRLGDQRWVLHDVARGKAVLHKPNQQGLAVVPLERPDFDPMLEDKQFSSMWRTYFKSIAIKERTNPRLQRQHMPRRYWKHLTEMK